MLAANVQSLSEKQTNNHFKLTEHACNIFMLPLRTQKFNDLVSLLWKKEMFYSRYC